MNGELSFFEIGAGDAGAARAFYGALFGWEFSEPPSGEGAVIEGSSVPGGIHGGDPGASPYLFFRVDDLDAAIARVRGLGGDAIGDEAGDDPETVARFGRFAFCTDDQGSRFGLHQPPPS
jgi:predicted enzyme related to lactoylglutathione lyase